jgi:hypothetical protein
VEPDASGTGCPPTSIGHAMKPDLVEYQKNLQEHVIEGLRNPDKPLNLHFYETKYRGALRIFDLCLTDRGVTVGETLVGSMQPIHPRWIPETNNGIYVHVNYRIYRSHSPDWVMRCFGSKVGLKDIQKMKQIFVVSEMRDIMPTVLRRLNEGLVSALRMV